MSGFTPINGPLVPVPRVAGTVPYVEDVECAEPNASSIDATDAARTAVDSHFDAAKGNAGRSNLTSRFSGTRIKTTTNTKRTGAPNSVSRLKRRKCEIATSLKTGQDYATPSTGEAKCEVTTADISRCPRLQPGDMSTVTSRRAPDATRAEDRTSSISRPIMSVLGTAHDPLITTMQAVQSSPVPGSVMYSSSPRAGVREGAVHCSRPLSDGSSLLNNSLHAVSPGDELSHARSIARTLDVNNEMCGMCEDVADFALLKLKDCTARDDRRTHKDHLLKDDHRARLPMTLQWDPTSETRSRHGECRKGKMACHVPGCPSWIDTER